MFWEVMTHFWKFWDIAEHLGYFEFWEVLGCFRKFGDIFGHLNMFCMFLNVLEHFGRFGDVLGCFGQNPKVSKSSQRYPNVAKSIQK